MKKYKLIILFQVIVIHFNHKNYKHFSFYDFLIH